LRELEITQSVVAMLVVTSGWAAPETIQLVEHAAALAEKSGNLTELVSWIRSRSLTKFLSGDYSAAITLADQRLELALQEGSPTSLAHAYEFQIQVRFLKGDHIGTEQHFIAGMKFFDDPHFKQVPGLAIVAFGAASWNAWILG
jgi:hypothetical protein